ncbi:serine/threonine/tyrosine-interacting-like protein 1 isoform X3 [Anser cygnoides]|uniref:serine/threonine/tyrosine-interacting-like protein 1 isoform X3 n=1 Tax=Anser cygnoides TaxID=8845 RepID=UPI0034D2BDCA
MATVGRGPGVATATGGGARPGARGAMAGVVLCEPGRLYNALQQHRRLPRLAEPNYLSLLDARTQREYNESHIITARKIEQSPTGKYLMPDSEELACVRYCVVYDCETSSLDLSDDEEEEKEKGSSGSSETENTDSSSLCSQNAKEGTAVRHARSLQQFTRHPVLVLRGGYKRFSACYHFLRTQKILWMPQVVELLFCSDAALRSISYGCRSTAAYLCIFVLSLSAAQSRNLCGLVLCHDVAPAALQVADDFSWPCEQQLGKTSNEPVMLWFLQTLQRIYSSPCLVRICFKQCHNESISVNYSH